MPVIRTYLASCAALTAAGLALAAPTQAQAGTVISNNLSKCSAGKGPAVKITVTGVKSSTGKMRVQLYRGTKADWMQKGRWIHRIQTPARKGTMTFCMPVPQAGTYGVAIRHDVNNNGKTDISKDGGGMSNNPGITLGTILRGGKPSYKKTAFGVGSGVKPISIRMRYR